MQVFGKGQNRGDTYIGDWSNDKFNGKGEYRWAAPDEATYKGDF